MAYRLIMAYHISHLKMKCATCILHCETKTKTGYASMASRSRDSSILWAALAQRRHASSPCGHSRCSNPSSQGCAEYKVKDVLHNEKPTSSHHAENLKEPLPTLPPLPFKLSIRNCNANCNAKVCQVSRLLSNASQASARRFRARCCANTAFRTAKPQIPHDLCFSLASPDTDLFKMVKAC